MGVRNKIGLLAGVLVLAAAHDAVAQLAGGPVAPPTAGHLTCWQQGKELFSDTGVLHLPTRETPPISLDQPGNAQVVVFPAGAETVCRFQKKPSAREAQPK